MEQILEPLIEKPTIGIIGARAQDMAMHGNMLNGLARLGIELGYNTLSIFEGNAGSAAQSVLTEEMEAYTEGGEPLEITAARFLSFSAEHPPQVAISNRFNRVVYGIAKWIAKNNINALLTPGHLMKDEIHRLAGNAALRAAYLVAGEQGRDMVVLNLHPSGRVEGKWKAADPEGDEPDASYTRIFIKAPAETEEDEGESMDKYSRQGPSVSSDKPEESSERTIRHVPLEHLVAITF